MQVDTLGTHKDTESLRDRLAASREAVQTLACEASAGLKELHTQAQTKPVSHQPQTRGSSIAHEADEGATVCCVTGRMWRGRCTLNW